MKKQTLTIVLLILTFATFGQSNEKVAFEQIAFDYYKNTILIENPPNKTLTLWTELENIEKSNFWFPRCVKEFQLKTNDSLKLNSSGKSEIILGVDKRFKINKNKKGKYPIVVSTVSFCNSPDQNIVMIIEYYKFKGITYHIVMNDKGRVISWCKGGWTV